MGRWFKLLALLSLIFFSYGTFKGHPYKVDSDGIYYYQYLLSIAQDQDVDFSNNYRVTPPDFVVNSTLDYYQLQAEIIPETGLPVNYFTVGPAILWYPFYMAVDTAIRSINALTGSSLGTTGWELPYQYGVMFSSVIYTTLAAWFSFRFLQQYFSDSAAFITSISSVTATALLYYATIDASMSHAYDYFTLAAFLYYYSRLVSESSGSFDWIAAGTYGGLHVLVRTQNIVTIGIFSIALVIYLLHKRKISMVPIFYLTPLALSLALLGVVNNQLFGNPFSIPQGSGFLNLFRPHIIEVLFSPRNGLFSHHPILLFGAGGLCYIGYRNRSAKMIIILYPLLLALLAQVYINSIAADWWAGAAFGGRRFTGMVAAFGFGFAGGLDVLGKTIGWRRIIKGVLALSVINFALMNIHMFVWNHHAPHNIVLWAFVIFPVWLLANLTAYGYIAMNVAGFALFLRALLPQRAH
jgi:hypothetical protein